MVLGAPTVPETYMFDVMRDAWQQLKRIIYLDFKDILKADTLPEADQLIIRALRPLVSKQVRTLEHAYTGHIDPILRHGASPAATDPIHYTASCFLHRSFQCLIELIAVCETVVRRRQKMLSDADLKVLRSRLTQLEGSTRATIIRHLADPDAAALDCNHNDETECTTSTHFHDVDDFIWPSNERQLARDAPYPSRPHVTFREFKIISA